MIPIDLPSYPVKVSVSITDDVLAARMSPEAVVRLGAAPHILPGVPVDGICGFDRGHGILFFTTGASKGIVAHECLHMVARIFEHMGVKFSADSEEAWCYLLDHLVDVSTELLEIAKETKQKRSQECPKLRISLKKPKKV